MTNRRKSHVHPGEPAIDSRVSRPGAHGIWRGRQAHLAPEATSAMAVLALSADLESWATSAADVGGRIGVLT